MSVVIGIDVGFVDTGLAAIEDGRPTWKSTIHVEGDSEETGPRYALLRECLEKLLLERVKKIPDLVVIEQPGHTLWTKRYKGKAYKPDPATLMKLYGAFAVTYSTVQRIWPEIQIRAITPQTWKGNFKKYLTASMLAGKYGLKNFHNDHEADALGLADWGWEAIEAERRAKKRLTNSDSAV